MPFYFFFPSSLFILSIRVERVGLLERWIRGAVRARGSECLGGTLQVPRLHFLFSQGSEFPFSCSKEREWIQLAHGYSLT